MQLRTLFVRFMDKVETVIRFELLSSTEINAPSFESAYACVMAAGVTTAPTHVLFQDLVNKKNIAGFGLTSKTVIDMDKWQIRVITPTTKTVSGAAIADKFAAQTASGTAKVNYLAWCGRGSCTNEVPEGTTYCDDHDPSRWYTDAEIIPAAWHAGYKRPCLGTTKKGLPCNGGAKIGTDYCGPHTPKEDSVTQEPVYNNFMEDRFCVAFTGHRPQKIGGYDINNPIRQAIRARIRAELVRLKKLHGDHLLVISGGALGIDQDAAEIAAELGIAYVVYAPCRNQDNKWPASSKAHYQAILEGAREVRYITDGPYTYSCMQLRNEAMVDDCNLLITVWDGEKKGGTWNCVEYAESVAREMIRIPVSV